MEILPVTRVSSEQRVNAENRLADMFARGYLTDEEYAARVNWTANAKTEEDLRVPFTDLPSVPDRSAYYDYLAGKHRERGTRDHYLTALQIVLVAFVILLIVCLI